MIRNRVAELLAVKFGGADKVNLAEVHRATGLAYDTVQDWYMNRVQRFDAPKLEAWCKYFGCQVGDLLTYEADSE